MTGLEILTINDITILKKLLYIVRRIALTVLLLMLLALANTMAQNVVYKGDTTPLAVDSLPGNNYSWDLYRDSTINFATTPGDIPGTSFEFIGGNTGARVNVKWLVTGIYFFKVTAYDITGCTINLAVGKINVRESMPTAILIPPNPDGICLGQTAMLEVNLTGAGPWSLTYTDGTNSWTVKDINDSKYLLSVSPKVLTNYWITEVSDGNGKNTEPSAKVFIDVYPLPVISKIYPNSP